MKDEAKTNQRIGLLLPSSFCLGVGTPDTNRTCDLSLRRGLLYPLSYRGVRLFYRTFDSHPGALESFA